MEVFVKAAALCLPFVAGCSKLTAASKQTAGASGATWTLKVDRAKATLPREAYERAADVIDHPETLFTKVGYLPLWTATGEEAKGRLPVGCTVVPKEVRLWESWFRDTIKNGDHVLTSAELLFLRDNVCMAVANDPRTRFAPPQTMSEIAQKVEAVRRETLKNLGIDRPSSVLTQITLADAAWVWPKSHRFYRDDPGDMYAKYITRANRWPTQDEYAKENTGLICQMAQPNMIYLLRALDRLNGGTGLQTGGVDGGVYLGSNSEGHNITGVRFDLGGRKAFANCFYDATPYVGGPGSNFVKSALLLLMGRGGHNQGGVMDRVGIENLANQYCMALRPHRSNRIGSRAEYPDAQYPLAENWPVFNLGNFVPQGPADWDKLPAREWVKFLKDQSLGPYPFKRYHQASEPVILRLRDETEKALQTFL